MTILIGISSCLLGEKVRFDGGHKKNAFVLDFLKSYFEFISVCPEVGAGLGIPRPTIQLKGDPKSPRVVEVMAQDKDHTAALTKFSNKSVKDFSNLSGFILKNKSPSCGWKNVKVYQEKGTPPKVGMGVFARALTEKYPYLPVEEEGRLQDSKLRENFVERVFVYYAWQQTAKNLKPKNLCDFHSRYKFTLLAHSQKIYRDLGRLVADLKSRPLKEIAADYISELMRGMALVATPKKHANVLMHCMGYIKQFLSSEDKAELLEAIDNYRQGLLPLIVPITLLKHHLRHHPDEYLMQQSYLNPYPQELMLRNHI